jgi:hypothetical protein
MGFRTKRATLYRTTKTKNSIISERKYERTIGCKGVPSSFRKKLTQEEKAEVESLWGSVIPDICFEELEIFKYFHGYKLGYVGFDIFLPLVSRKLNDYHYTKFYEDKCLTDSFSSVFKMPEVVLKCIGGRLI